MNLRPWRGALQLAVSLGALWLISRSVSLQDLTRLWSLADGGLLFAAVALLPLNLGLQLMKWRTLLLGLEVLPPGKQILRSWFLGLLLGLLTPGRLGEHGRILFLRDIPRSRLLTLSLLERAASSVVTVFLGLACLLALPHSWFPGLPRQAILVYAGVSFLLHLLALAVLLRPVLLGGLLDRLPRLREHRRLQEARAALAGIAPSHRLALLGWSLAFWLCFTGQFVLLIRSLGFEHSLSWAAAGGTFLLNALFPISFGNLGLRELFSAALFQSIGAEAALAVGASLLLFSINMLLPALISLPLLRSGRAS